MMRRLSAIPCAAAVAILMFAGATDAQAQITRVEPRQSIGVNFGYFMVRPEESRVRGDVLIADLTDPEPLAFNINDFNGPAVGGEWLFGLGDYLEGGVGAGFYQRTVPSVYLRVVNEGGREIEQDLKLRIVPLSATVRFLPIGRGGVEPYVGAGIGVFNWQYSEVGEFVDTFDSSVFRGRFRDNGTTAGPVLLGGIRFPVADIWMLGGEIRYQKAEGTIGADADLLGDRIDLGGWNAGVTLHLRF